MSLMKTFARSGIQDSLPGVLPFKRSFLTSTPRTFNKLSSSQLFFATFNKSASYRNLSTVPSFTSKNFPISFNKTQSIFNPQLSSTCLLSAVRSYSTAPKPSQQEVPKTDGKSVVKGEKEEKAVVTKKKSIMLRIKEEVLHYYHGFKLLALETKISSKLLFRLLKGYDLTRREQRQLKRTTTDLVRLVPFLFFVIVPFMELLLPVFIKLFPNMLPSTFESKDQTELKRQKLFKARLEVSNFLQDTVNEAAKSGHSLHPEAASEFSELFRKVRTTGEAVSTETLIKLAQELKDELTLDNLSRPQLVSLCRYMNIKPFGTDAILAFQIRNRMRYLRADDRMINAEGVTELTVPELTQACQSRGIRTFNSSPEAMRTNLQQWLELNLKHKVPTTVLIMSQAFSIPESQNNFSEALQATLSSLPDELVKEAELTYSETRGSATNKQRLEVIEEQEERIAEEKEQEEREEEARKKDEEEEEARKKDEEEEEARKKDEEEKSLQKKNTEESANKPN